MRLMPLLCLLLAPAALAGPRLAPQTVEGITVQAPEGWTVTVLKAPVFVIQMEAKPGAPDSPSFLAAFMPLSQGPATPQIFIDQITQETMPEHQVIEEKTQAPGAQRLRVLEGPVRGIPAKMAAFQMIQAEGVGVGFAALLIAPAAEFDALGGASLLFQLSSGLDQARGATPTPAAPSPPPAPIKHPAEYASTQMPTLYYLAAEGDKLGPKEIEAALGALTKDERLMLSLNAAFAHQLHRQVCQLNGRYVLNISEHTPPLTCAENLKSFMQTLQFVDNDPNRALAQAKTERDQITVSWKCETGRMDKLTCQQYYRLRMHMQNMHHENMMRIITNIGGNSCLIGDPGCVPN